ncbi:hypothetical protein AWB91_25665 [Mycobacterium paraense]|uniref:Uncharacterized protein n=1 Tax=Mycobacterium paraense TaxID=767916 RepID=A0A1X2ADT1_9MYCO|nr:hypothetical protein [Mycobacterium paraense]MCV7445174.1 hypothetical protein [Mycobacterium paraense]ORW29395.1 hypothetical protein AWB91_25665 [Mycobacterium paraense]ORW45785.1 hypothetical protein AWB88_03330 [Mycobacterium paraense]ORW46441.1 hypothetical protein AWB89_12330 [Mycobacterium paraense]ORW49524.1 hypothetical protein AWB90_09855 [Mycobacterium paraense]
MRAVVIAVCSAIVSVLLSVPTVAHADPCVNGTVRPGPGAAVLLCQDRGWLLVIPKGAGGYGPDQPLPQTCATFADKYMCPTAG